MRSRVRPLLAALLLAASACSVIRGMFPSLGPKPRPFNHEAHLVRGVACLDCHETAQKEVRAGMPGKAFCMNCHEGLDKDPGKPLEKKVAAFLDAEGNPVWSRFTAQSDDIRFSHKAHAEKKIACTACHAGIDKDTGLVPGLVQRMSSCTTCHDKEAPSKNDCATCHVRTDRSILPANHRQLWMQVHGVCSRQGSAVATANDCSLCHRSDSCTTCHQTRPPRDHTGFWRLKAHGIAAGIDRSRCQVCHTSDGCNRCHESSAPSSHTAGFNAPRNGHCASCHVPLQTTGSCYVCHKSTPGHAAAPPKPAWHTAAMDCRSCHAGSLKHFDNGDNCNACHW